MDIKTFAKEHFEEYKALICQLTAIPAPSHHEKRRAAFICEYLHQLGYGQAFIDDAKNVICEVKGSDLEAPVHIFMAHTDTVSLMRQRFRLLWKTAALRRGSWG
ncbi:MAG: hypothetical protein ACLUI7_08845 [Coprococcus sp.]